MDYFIKLRRLLIWNGDFSRLVLSNSYKIPQNISPLLWVSIPQQGKVFCKVSFLAGPISFSIIQKHIIDVVCFLWCIEQGGWGRHYAWTRREEYRLPRCSFRLFLSSHKNWFVPLLWKIWGGSRYELWWLLSLQDIARRTQKPFRNFPDS